MSEQSQQPALEGLPQNQITVDSLMLCDFAEVHDGKLYIMGGGWNRIIGQELPIVRAPLPVAILLRIPWNETNRQFHIVLYFQDEDGKQLDPPGSISGNLTMGRPADATPGGALLAPIALSFPMIFAEQPMTVELILEIDGRIVERRPIELSSR